MSRTIAGIHEMQSDMETLMTCKAQHLLVNIIITVLPIANEHTEAVFQADPVNTLLRLCACILKLDKLDQ